MRKEFEMNEKSVAEFMINEILEKGYVYQEYLVHDIQEKFGEEYVYVNENGNLAISKKVLNEFKKLKEVNGIEWDNRERCWTKN